MTLKKPSNENGYAANMTDIAPLLSRIADALERIAPPAAADADLLAHPAYLWREGTLSAVADFRALPLERLTGIDTQKQALLRNTRRLANGLPAQDVLLRSEEHTSELQSLMRISYAVICLKKKKKHISTTT